MDASAVRAWKIQWSPRRKRPPASASEKETTTPCSSTTCVASDAGTGISPPLASRSATSAPVASRTTPDWSQRRTRKCRFAASSAFAGWSSGGSAGVNSIVRSASSTVTLRIGPGSKLYSALSSMISTQSLVEMRSTSSLPTDARRRTIDETISTTGIATDTFTRDHLKVTSSDAGSPPSWISTRYVWFSRPRYPPSGGSSHGSSSPTSTVPFVNRPSDGRITSSQSSPRSSSLVWQVAPSGTSSSRTCQAVCQRAGVSTPTALSTRSGSSRCVTSRVQTSRYARRVPVSGSGSGVGMFQYGCSWYGVSVVPVTSRRSSSKPSCSTPWFSASSPSTYMRPRPIVSSPSESSTRKASGVCLGTQATPWWSGSGPKEVRSQLSARSRRSSSATSSLKSASRSNLPCWRTTPAKSRSGSNLTRLRSAAMPLPLPGHSCRVEEPGLKAVAKVFVEPHAQVGLTLGLVELVRHTYLALVARAGPHRVMGRAPELHVAVVAIPHRRVERAVRGVVADALELARCARARRHEREADTADLAALGPHRRDPRVATFCETPQQQRVGDVEALCVHLAEHCARVEPEVPPRFHAVARVAIRRVRDGQQAAASGRRTPAECDLVLTRGVDDGVARLHIGAVNGDDRADDAVVERHLREGMQHDQARAPDRVRLAVRIARHARHERAVAQDETARFGVRRLLDHQRPACEHESVEHDRRARIHRELELIGVLEQGAGAVGRAEHEVAVVGVRRRRGRADRRWRGVRPVVLDLHRAAPGDRRERRPERVAAVHLHDGVRQVERLRAIVAPASDGEGRAVVEGREPDVARGRSGRERDPSQHRVDGDVRVAGLRDVHPGVGRGRIVGEIADPDIGDGDGHDVRRGLGLQEERPPGAVQLFQV